MTLSASPKYFLIAGLIGVAITFKGGNRYIKAKCKNKER